MSLWGIAWAYLWNRKLTTGLTILSVGLAVALISTVLTLRDETRKRFEEEGQAFDLVIGAKGSPLQLVLSSVYYMDSPTGNIPYSDYARLLEEPDVANAYPIALGDTYRGALIVGTTRDFFDHVWESPFTNEVRRPFVLADGRYFERPTEVVVGGLVAAQNGLSVGDSFVGTHGFVEMDAALAEAAGMTGHADTPFQVVGVLEIRGTPNDRAIFTHIDSVYLMHEDHEEYFVSPGEALRRQAEAEQAAEPDAGLTSDAHAADQATEFAPVDYTNKAITAALVQLESPALRFTFKQYVNEQYNAQAQIPIQIISDLYDNLLGTVKAVLLAIGYLVVVISALSILIGLYLSIIQRRRDLAIMRALGASSYEIFGAVLIEAFWVTALGILSGWLIGGVVSYGVGLYLAREVGMQIGALTLSREAVGAFATVGIVGLLAGIIPAIQAYRTDVARDLAAP